MGAQAVIEPPAAVPKVQRIKNYAHVPDVTLKSPKGLLQRRVARGEIPKEDLAGLLNRQGLDFFR